MYQHCTFRQGPMIALTWPQVLAFRLTRHHLAKRAPRSRLTQVVGDVCGIHAQLMSAAELAIWARVDGITRDEIQTALWHRRNLVKTWCMRGTLHLRKRRCLAPENLAQLGQLRLAWIGRKSCRVLFLRRSGDPVCRVPKKCRITHLSVFGNCLPSHGGDAHCGSSRWIVPAHSPRRRFLLAPSGCRAFNRILVGGDQVRFSVRVGDKHLAERHGATVYVGLVQRHRGGYKRGVQEGRT